LSYLIGMNKTQMMNALSGPLEGFWGREKRIIFFLDIQ
jgi:hypothetical protein